MKINKIISLIMISLMLFSAVEYSALAASVNYIDLAKGNILQDVDAASTVCCGKVGNNYCVNTDASKCEQGFGNSPFSCDKVDYCKSVCMIDGKGVCNQQVPKAKCEELRKKDPSIVCSEQADCSINQCSAGFCVINGQCQGRISQGQCRIVANDLDVPFVFDTSSSTEAECRQKHSTIEGCCVSGDSCTRTTAKECSGDFRANMLCSNDALAGICDVTKQDDRTCGPDEEDVYFVDSKGNLENVVGVSYDGFIHDSASDVAGKIGDCDYTKGTACGLDEKNEFACIDINCNVGDKFVLKAVNPATGEVNPEILTVTSDILGGKNARRNGESWCTLSDNKAQINKDLSTSQSAGSRHYVYSCNQGRVEVDPCGEFRDETCSSSVDTATGTELESARCVDNKWEQCQSCGDSGNGFGFKEALLFGFGGDCKRSECLALGVSDNAEKSHCVFDSDLTNECYPKYPPGFEFWKAAESDQKREQRVCDIGSCGGGGDSWSNQCDERECNAIGDCRFRDTISVTEGVIYGGAIGATAGYSISVAIEAAVASAGAEAGAASVEGLTLTTATGTSTTVSAAQATALSEAALAKGATDATVVAAAAKAGIPLSKTVASYTMQTIQIAAKSASISKAATLGYGLKGATLYPLASSGVRASKNQIKRLWD